MEILPLLDDFLLNLKVNNYSEETLYNYERDLNVFENFLKDSQLNFKKLTKKDILNYKAFLTSIDRTTAKNQKTSQKLSSYSVNRMLSALRAYFKYLIDMDYPAPLPPEVIKMIKTEKKKSQVPELDDLVKMLEAPEKFEKNKKVALRNRAMLELLFATGLRITELLNLKIDQIDKEGKIFVMGKGKKQRFVYLTPRALKHLNKYLEIREDTSDYLFLPYRGLNFKNKDKRISTNYLQAKIKRYRELLDINVPLSAHSLRHGFATYLAESGASPAAIQILLGHESLDTTTRYVHASDKYAQKMHKKYHPLNDEEEKK